MFKTITVVSAANDYARLAESWGLKLAGMFRSRLRALVAWDPDEVARARMHGEATAPERLSEQTTRDVVEQARAQGLRAEGLFRGEGSLKGILTEAVEADLLVLGKPKPQQAENDSIARAILDSELPILRRAECSVLVVSQEAGQLRNVLVSYLGGEEGKSALRAAGFIAQAASARLTAVSCKGDMAEAEILVSRAARYLEGFDLPHVNPLAFSVPSNSPDQILHTAAETKADMIVLGQEPHGIIHSFFAGDSAEAVSLSTLLPVLIAR